MQPQAGGLPLGYTELEYLESSGTQYLNAGNWSSEGFNTRGVFELSSASQSATEFAWGGQTIVGNSFLWLQSCLGWRRADESPGVLNLQNFIKGELAEKNTVRTTPDGVYWNNVFSPFPEATPNFSVFIYVFAASDRGRPSSFANNLKIFELNISNNEKSLHFIPALDQEGIPCMYEIVSRQPYYNAGTGTFGYRIKTSGEAAAPFALRDPYYTAPSGVYARLIAENTLDILADTDIASDAAEQAGYTWHPNTGDAYTAYDITPSPEITA